MKTSLELEIRTPIKQLKIHLLESIKKRLGSLSSLQKVLTIFLEAPQIALVIQETDVFLPDLAVETTTVNYTCEGSGIPAVGEYLPVDLKLSPFSLHSFSILPSFSSATAVELSLASHFLANLLINVGT